MEGGELLETKFEHFQDCHELFYVGQDRETGVIETGIGGKVFSDYNETFKNV